MFSLGNFLDYLASQWSDLVGLAIDHAVVVAVALAIAAAISVTVGVLTYRREAASVVALGVAGAFLTIPSFALFGLLIPILGLGFLPTVVALVAYALLPILRNTITGLRGVDPAVVEAAQGMGLSARQRLVRVELPLAWPVILAGLRVSTLLLVGIAAIAAAVNGPGLGNDIFAGLARIGSATAINLVVGGIVGVMVLALLFDGLFLTLSRFTTPRGIRD